jgi:hypothetical protein
MKQPKNITSLMIPNRFICQGKELYVAWVIDGYYKQPKTTNGVIVRPQYYLISNKNNEFLIVIDYYIYQMLQKDDIFMPVTTNLKLIPLSNIVKDGDKVPAAIMNKALSNG